MRQLWPVRADCATYRVAWCVSHTSFAQGAPPPRETRSPKLTCVLQRLMRAAHGGSQTPSPALHDAALSTPPRAWGGRDYRSHRRSHRPSSLATPPPPPARLLRAKPSRLEGGAPVPALRRGRAASRGRRASRSAPIRTVRAHGGAPGLGVGRRAYGCCALILASATSANLGCPCFPEPCSSPRPRDISATPRLD